MVNGLPDLLILLERDCAKASDGKLIWWIDLAQRIQQSEQPPAWRSEMVCRIQFLLVDAKQLTRDEFRQALETGEIPPIARPTIGMSRP